jgi:hypothetical protein
VDQFDVLGIFLSAIQNGEASLGGLLPTKFAANFFCGFVFLISRGQIFLWLCFLFAKVRFFCSFVFLSCRGDIFM